METERLLDVSVEDMRNIFGKQDHHIRKLEEELLFSINELGIGAGGFGGRITALGVNVETYPTHIAGLPVAVNICCHVNRHITCVL